MTLTDSKDDGRWPLGEVVAVDGSQALVLLDGDQALPGRHVTVGAMLTIAAPDALAIGVVTRVGSSQGATTADVAFLGEIVGRGATARFHRGLTSYPCIGDRVEMARHDELSLVYGNDRPGLINIGTHRHDMTIPARIEAREMLTKHFAVFGATGVGKSSSVALILHRLIASQPGLRIFLIDPHNEYAASFEGKAQVLNPANLKLPFWLFNFEEIVDVFFRGRPGLDDEVELLAQAIPLAKARYMGQKSSLAAGADWQAAMRQGGFTGDTPSPYQLNDLIALIDDQMGKLENRSSAGTHRRLLSRIQTVRNDPRYRFMFDNANVGGDTMVDVVGQLFRLPLDDRPMTVIQLAGFPAEVVDSVVSVMCRMAFEFGLWSDGAAPLLFVCEEAHRYAPSDRSVGFGPTRKALSRIAKEGRKYGVYLGLVTQRPSELDATIISQCNTVIAMRLANERDQAIIRSAVSDAAATLLSFLPSLGMREALVFGDGVLLPTRLHFDDLPAHAIPRSEMAGSAEAARPALDSAFVAGVIARWRGAMMARPAGGGSPADGIDHLAAGEFSALAPTSPMRGGGHTAGAMPAAAPPSWPARGPAPRAELDMSALRRQLSDKQGR